MSKNDSTTALPAGRLDVRSLPSNQPAVGPLYPEFPWKVFNAKGIACIYETDKENVLDLLPPEVTIATDPPQVICWLNGGYEIGIGGGPYQEMAPLIPVLYKGELHIFPWVVYLGHGTEEWFAAGREVLGDQKKLAHISLTQEMGKGLIIGTVERPLRHRLVTQIVGPLERQCDESAFAFPPVIGLRILPNPEGTGPGVAQLYKKPVISTLKKAEDGSAMLFEGQGTVEFGRSEQDPLYKLEVRKHVTAYYAEFSTIEQPTGVVLKDYLAESR